LEAGAKNCATIIVSHRLGALRHADEILYLEDGQIVERGNHDALIAAGGRYAALFALQSLGAGSDTDIETGTGANTGANTGAAMKGAAE